MYEHECSNLSNTNQLRWAVLHGPIPAYTSHRVQVVCLNVNHDNTLHDNILTHVLSNLHYHNMKGSGDLLFVYGSLAATGDCLIYQYHGRSSLDGSCSHSQGYNEVILLQLGNIRNGCKLLIETACQVVGKERVQFGV